MSAKRPYRLRRWRPSIERAHTHQFANALLRRRDTRVTALVVGRLVIIWEAPQNAGSD